MVNFISNLCEMCEKWRCDMVRNVLKAVKDVVRENFKRNFRSVISTIRHPNCEFDPGASASKDSFFAGGNIVRWNSFVVGCSFGRYSFCGRNCSLFYSDIGAYTSIAANVRIGLAAHPLDRNVALHTCFHHAWEQVPFSVKDSSCVAFKRTQIGSDVWIGDSVIIPGGVKIGHGAVIGAGSVITKDVPPYAIVVGANRILRYRFDEETRKRLLEIAWWDWDNQTIEGFLPFINDSEEFLRECDRRKKA